MQEDIENYGWQKKCILLTIHAVFSLLRSALHNDKIAQGSFHQPHTIAAVCRVCVYVCVHFPFTLAGQRNKERMNILSYSDTHKDL